MTSHRIADLKRESAFPEPILCVNRDGQILGANKAAHRAFSLSQTPHSLEVLVQGQQISMDETLRLWLQNGTLIRGLLTLVDKDGHHYGCFGARLPDEDGNAETQRILIRCDKKITANNRFLDLNKKILNLNNEISLRRRSEQLLSLEKERLHVTLRSIGDGVITTDTEGRVTFLNPIAETMTGWSNDEAQLRPLLDVFNICSSISGQAVVNPVQRVIETGILQSLDKNTRLTSRDGRKYLIEDSANAIRDKSGKIIGVILVFRDVTEAIEMAEKISYQATHDSLTGLLNRTAFDRQLKKLLDTDHYDQREHVLLFMDLDQFKIINDTSGHLAGDMLLKTLATVMKRKLRDSDALARLGGDEFAVLLEDCPKAKATQIANSLREAISNFKFAWEGKPYSIGVSIGQVNFDSTSNSYIELLKAADSSCYIAKDRGRNRIHVHGSDLEEANFRSDQMEWVIRIKEAFDHDRFRLHYQPIVPVESASGNQAGMHCEILIRMEDTDGRTLSPGLFLPAAERYDLMAPIDKWVMETTFEILEQDVNAEVRICSINLSAASLRDDDLVSTVKNLLQKHSIAPKTICFEITETSAISNLGKAIETISALRAIGCKFALDDFGSGMASFSYLKWLPVDYLKIDGAFVKGMVEDPVDREMVKAIHSIAQALDLKTVAEFVENKAILQELSAIGVDYAQGYGIAKPKPFALDNLQTKPMTISSTNEVGG